MSISYGDAAHAALRSLVAAVERELVLLVAPEALRGRWDELVSVLALGPAPELRTCPKCNELGMRAATRCGRCWSPLTPV